MGREVRVGSASPVFADLLRPSRYKALYGGRGSGKSHFFAEALVANAAENTGFRAVCVREVQKSLKESAKRLIEDKIEALGFAGHFDIQNDVIKTPGGGSIIFQGMQDHTAESIKSLENLNVAFIEEAATLSAKSLELLRPTIRGAGSELWFSWNPRSASDPVDAFFRGETPPENAIIRRINYDQNVFFPAELEGERRHDELHKPDRYGHIWLGDFEPQSVGAIWDRLMIHNTRRDKAPVMGRILVGVDPAGSSAPGADEHGIIVGGLGEDGEGYVLDDMSTKGSPRQWGERVAAAHDLWSADAVVVETNYGGEMVANTIKSMRPDIRVIEVRATRGKHVRAEPIAALYSLGRVHHVGTFERLESQLCAMTAAGYEGDGSPDRCLAAGTVIDTSRGGVAIEDVVPGDKVMTRKGYRRVTNAARTGESVPVFRVDISGGRSLIGTGSHPVYVAGRGFIALDTLARGDILMTCTNMSSSLRAASMFATRIRLTVLSAFISITGQMADASGHLRSTATSGRTTTGQSLTAILSTIWMGTRSTMNPTTLSAVPTRITRNTTRRTMPRPWRAWIMPEVMRTLGRAARKAWSFTASLVSPLGPTASPLLALAGNAGRSSTRFPGTETSVPRRAGIAGGKRTAPIMSSASARHVAGRSTSSGPARNASAPASVLGLSDAGKADVYNLSVERDNEYFANGVLVHNCDAMVWVMTELFPAMTRTKSRTTTIEPLGVGGWMG